MEGNIQVGTVQWSLLNSKLFSSAGLFVEKENMFQILIELCVQVYTWATEHVRPVELKAVNTKYLCGAAEQRLTNCFKANALGIFPIF